MAVLSKIPSNNGLLSISADACVVGAKKLGILNSAEGIELGRAVKGTNVYFPDMKIEEITVVFNTEDQYGMNIELKGSL